MRDRIIGALETGCRLGEMLKIQNRHVLWDTHQIVIPADTRRTPNPVAFRSSRKDVSRSY
jgi:integrase